MNQLLKKLETLSEEEVASLYKKVFEGVDGQLVLEDLKNRCYSYAPLPYGEEGQRAEGKRAIIIHIETNMNYEPEENQ